MKDSSNNIDTQEGNNATNSLYHKYLKIPTNIENQTRNTVLIKKKYGNFCTMEIKYANIKIIIITIEGYCRR